MLHQPGRPGSQFVEIEFTDPNGRPYVRRYGVERDTVGMATNRGELASDETAREASGYSQRRSRRSQRRWFRRRW
jgi:hypothetical protein